MTKEERDKLREIASKATQVVSWYAHPAEVRGPFHRWLNISEVDDKYKGNVASQADDAEFAAAAMNNLVPLLDTIDKLEKQVKSLEVDLAIESELTGRTENR
jgi:hypothetical protein